MAAPDPEKGFVARLRAALPDVAVGNRLTTSRPAVVVELTPGGVTELPGWIDRVRLDLVCYGNTDDPDAAAPAVTARALAAQVRAAVIHGFTAGGQHVARVAADPPYPLADPLTFEARSYVPVTASVFAIPA